MRNFSTPESALKGEVTKLAIVECIVSVAIYVAIGFYRGTFAQLALAIVVAPLMLFRTDKSAEWGYRIYGRCWEWVFARERGVWFWRSLAIPFIGFALRVAATLLWAIRSPLYTLRQMPDNWIRQSLCTDLRHPPEIMPLEASKSDMKEVVTFATVIWAIRETKGNGLATAVVSMFLLPILVFGFLPAVLYRITFKATAIAYIPFVWVAHTDLRSPLSAEARLERITKGEWEKIRRKFSIAVLGIFGLKTAVMFGWIDASRLLEKIPSQKLIDTFIRPASFPWWQWTLIADAVLTFALFLLADGALARIKDRHAWPEKTVLNTVACGTFVRSALSIVTMARVFWIAMQAVAPNALHGLFW